MRTASLALGLATLLKAGLLAAAPDAGNARAGGTQAASDSPAAARSRALPGAAAIVPGLVVHGSGHFALAEPSTARNLLLMEGIGLGLFLGGGVTIVLTGASRYLVAPAATATILGFGLFSTSYLADIYGSIATDGNAALSRYRAPARWETQLGYLRIHDPQFDYRDFVFERVSRQIGPLRLSPSGIFSMRGDTARYRLEAQYRLEGDVDEPRPSDVSFLDLTLGLVHQRHRPEHFSKSQAELSLDARYDLARLGPSLRGAFIELCAGYALARTDYDPSGFRLPSDLEHALLGRFGFGVTLRGLSRAGSEALVYYDHRHDDYVAGLKLSGIGSGVLGHFGASLRWFASDSVGAALDAQAGSAYLGGLSLIYRAGIPHSPRRPRP